MKVPDLFKSHQKDSPDVKMMQRNSYARIDSVKDFKDELDQPLQPHIEPAAVNKCSTLQAFGNTIKSFVGVGMLALPYAIRQSGLWSGVVGLIIIGFASCYTMKSLIRCKIEMEIRKKFANEANNHSSHPVVLDDAEITYGSIGKHIFGRLGLVLVNFAILTSQIGFCCAYILFIVHNLNSIWHDVNVRIYALIFAPVFVVLAWVRSMKFLAPVSLIANAALVLAVGVIFYFGFSNGIQAQDSYPFIHIDKFPFFFGIAVFGFEGINLSIPIQSSMANPKAYSRMLDLSLICVGSLYIVFGTLGYLFFGEGTDSIITRNLPDNAIVTIVKIALIAELTLSYPIQLFPVTIIVESALEKYLTTYKTIKQNIIRASLVALTVGISISIPFFELLTSFIGSFSNSMVVFIFPSLFLMAIFRGRLSWPEVVLNIFILVLGIIASAISSAIAIIGIIEAVQDGVPDNEY